MTNYEKELLMNDKYETVYATAERKAKEIKHNCKVCPFGGRWCYANTTMWGCYQVWLSYLLKKE